MIAGRVVLLGVEWRCVVRSSFACNMPQRFASTRVWLAYSNRTSRTLGRIGKKGTGRTNSVDAELVIHYVRCPLLGKTTRLNGTGRDECPSLSLPRGVETRWGGFKDLSLLAAFRVTTVDQRCYYCQWRRHPDMLIRPTRMWADWSH